MPLLQPGLQWQSWQSWLETLEETLQAVCSTHSSLAETIQFVAISDLTYDISTITLPDASTVQSTVRAV